MKFKFALAYVAVLAFLAKGVDKAVGVVLVAHDKAVEAESAARYTAEGAGFAEVRAKVQQQRDRCDDARRVLEQETASLVALNVGHSAAISEVTNKAYPNAR